MNSIRIITLFSLIFFTVNDDPPTNIKFNYFGTKMELTLPANELVDNDDEECLRLSFEEIKNSDWPNQFKNMFKKLGVQKKPYAQLLFLIQFFNSFQNDDTNKFFTFNKMIQYRRANRKSKILCTLAFAQALGWDVQVFKNDALGYYLGVNYGSKIDCGYYIEWQGIRYIFKEFDMENRLGMVKFKNPHTWIKLPTLSQNLNPVYHPYILPPFSSNREKKLTWEWKGKKYSIIANLSDDQLSYVKLLPRDFKDMVLIGIEELKNTRIPKQLKELTKNMDEIEKVNFLMKFVQKAFQYKTSDIKTVTESFYDGYNDCDTRSIVLAGLLMTVIGYNASDILGLEWPNQHMALAVKPKTVFAKQNLAGGSITYNGEKYFIFDSTYEGDTAWGSMMPNLPKKCTIIEFEK